MLYGSCVWLRQATLYNNCLDISTLHKDESAATRSRRWVVSQQMSLCTSNILCWSIISTGSWLESYSQNMPHTKPVDISLLNIMTSVRSAPRLLWPNFTNFQIILPSRLRLTFIILHFFLIFTARRNFRIASVVPAIAIPSVCVSVCLSVTRRYCVKTTARSTVQFALSDSKMCPVFRNQKILPRDDRFPLKSWLQVTYPLLTAASLDTFCLEHLNGKS